MAVPCILAHRLFLCLCFRGKKWLVTRSPPSETSNLALLRARQRNVEDFFEYIGIKSRVVFSTEWTPVEAGEPELRQILTMPIPRWQGSGTSSQ